MAIPETSVEKTSPRALRKAAKANEMESISEDSVSSSGVNLEAPVSSRGGRRGSRVPSSAQ